MRMLLCVAVCCSVLLWVAVCCSVMRLMQRVAGILQCVAACWCKSSWRMRHPVWREEGRDMERSCRDVTSDSCMKLSTNFPWRLRRVAACWCKSSRRMRHPLCCRVLQGVAGCCIVLQCVAWCASSRKLRNPGCCSVLQGVQLCGSMWCGAHCNTNTLQHPSAPFYALQHTATHCNTLQHIATP